ncbi:MAG: BamA/TamA family outer membrane protein, partial [Thermoanaerobaculales bacterium]|nr:BamA/TamA family outer membrane protein [Thermoanaerobaculales bacterium]
FQIDLSDESISNLTDSEAYDGAPVYSPDGLHLVFTSQEGLETKLGELSLSGDNQRRQLTFGPGSDDGAFFSRDGQRLYFASDREQGVWDIYSMDLEHHSLHRLTHVIGAALNPTPIETLEGERVVYQGFSHGQWKLYVADPNQAEEVGELQTPKIGLDLEDFVPAVSLSIDPTLARKAKKKFSIDDLSVNIGVDQDGNFRSFTYLVMTDQFGDQRFTLVLDSIDTFSNFRLAWTNLKPRLNWGAFLYDDRSFYITGYDPESIEVTEREQLFRRTGVSAFGQYPFSTHYRVEGSFGFEDRKADIPFLTEDGLVIRSFSDQVPLVTMGIVGDTTRFNYYGPHQGSRWSARLFYGYDLDDGGALYNDLIVEWRKYLAISRRQELALRVYAAYSDGNASNVYAIGGYDTVRGFRTRGLAGNRVSFANIEWRFPLVDRLDLAFMRVGEVRGRLFFDFGAAWSEYDGQKFNYKGEPGFQFMGEKTLEDGTVVCESGRLCDGVASYGFGITAWLMGLPMHWDFVRQYDFKDSIGNTEVQFWIGMRV